MARSSDVWLADIEEVGSETTDEPLEEDLEDCGGYQTFEKAECRFQKVVEAASANLEEREEQEGNDERKQSGEPNRNCAGRQCLKSTTSRAMMRTNFFAEWVCILRVYDFTVRERDWEAPCWGWIGKVNAKTNG